MRIPVDMSGLTFMAAAPARPVTDFETRQHKADENGEPLYNLQVVWLEDGGAQIISVKVAGEPQVAQGAMLAFEGLVAFPWAMNDRSGPRSGVAFRADRIKVIGVGGSSANGRASEKAAA